MGELFDFLVENEESFRKARLPALYSDFRGQQTTNPDGYQANVSAWRRALASIARAGIAPSPRSAATSGPKGSSASMLALDVDEPLLHALESRQYGRPLALGAVVREAVAARDLMPMGDFMRARESIYHRSWAAVPWGVVSWGLRQMGLTGGLASASASGEDRLPKGQYVVLANAEAAAKAFADRSAGLGSRFERTWSRSQFHKTFAAGILDNGRPLSETDLDVLLRFLSRDKGLILYDGKTVKVRSPGEAEEQAGMTEEDAAIASLKELISHLTHQSSLLSTRAEELSATAKEAVLRKNRVAALAALRSKKLAESSLEKRLATLGQLEEVSARIEQASDNVQAVRVMQASVGVLAGLNARVGGAEGVEGVVEQLREQMGAADEVSSILAEAGPIVDEGEIDDELAALEAEETRRKLAELEALKPAAPEEEKAKEASGTSVGEAAEELRKMSLEGAPDPEPAQLAS